MTAVPSSAVVPKFDRALSRLGLGGHEYADDGRLKGFGDDDLQKAIQPGYRRDDFGGPERAQLVHDALELGVRFFDVTIDPEVKALGRALPASTAALVQVRPQGMCYRYEPGNPGLIDVERITAEAKRLTDLLLGRPIDVLNFGVEAEAIALTPDYLARLAHAIGQLKSDGLIRFASCDSLFSGALQYDALIDTGAFDAVWISFGPLDPAPAEGVLDHAASAGMAVITREVFAKGQLFRLLPDAGLEAAAGDVASAAVRWVLHHASVTTLVVGARNTQQLVSAAEASNTPFDAADADLLDRLLSSPAAAQFAAENRAKFLSPNR
jgi:aryl-alcohol dehydrogenase-like predicted oxidoreductase